MKKYILITLALILSISGVVYATNYGQVVEQRTVKFNEDTYLGDDGYYTYGEKLHAQKVSEFESNIVNELKKQNEILRDLVNKLGGQGTLPPTPPTAQPPANIPEVPVPADNYSDLERQVFNIFKESCVKCHSETTANGGLVLVDNGVLTDIPAFVGVLIHHRTNGINLNVAEGEARMPKGSVPLDTEKVETIRLWVVEKAKKDKEKVK
jgi:mono/diheme cytochrome c family protein